MALLCVAAREAAHACISHAATRRQAGVHGVGVRRGNYPCLIEALPLPHRPCARARLGRVLHTLAEIRARARVDARAGLKNSRARVLGKKSTNPAEFCMHY